MKIFSWASHKWTTWIYNVVLNTFFESIEKEITMQIFSFIFLHTNTHENEEVEKTEERYTHLYLSMNMLNEMKLLALWSGYLVEKKKMNWIREYVNRWEIQNIHQHPKAKALMNTEYSTTITKWNCAISHFERNTRELKGEEKKNTQQRILFTYWLCEKIDKKEKQAIKQKKNTEKKKQYTATANIVIK